VKLANYSTVRAALLLALLVQACAPSQEAESPSDHFTGTHLGLSDSVLAVFGTDQESAAYDLSTFTDTHLLSDGRLAVLCCGNTIMIYAADGRHVATYGGRGDGPDRFRTARMTVLPGDTLLVYDGMSKRATWIDPSVGIIRTLAYRNEVPVSFAIPIGVSTSGAILISSLHSFPNLVPPEAQDTVRTRADVISVLPDGNSTVLFQVPDLLLVGRPSPYGPPGFRVLDLVRYAGVGIIEVHQGVAYLLAGDSRRVVVRRLEDGVQPERSFEIAVPRAVVSDRDKERMIEAEIAPLQSGSPGGHAPPPDMAAALTFLRTSAFADSFPPIAELFLDIDNGQLWARHGGSRDAIGWGATRATLDGERTAVVESGLPGSRPLAFRGSDVLLARTGESGVVVFELRRLVGN